MPRGNFRRSKATWAKMGREAGKVSGMVRREKALQRYLEVARQYGLWEALRQCRATSWQTGWAKGHARGKIYGYECAMAELGITKRVS